MISGDQEIDVKDWRANTVYKDCKESDDIAVWFWKVRVNRALYPVEDECG
jgi:hypothetical protein